MFGVYYFARLLISLKKKSEKKTHQAAYRGSLTLLLSTAISLAIKRINLAIVSPFSTLKSEMIPSIQVNNLQLLRILFYSLDKQIPQPELALKDNFFQTNLFCC
ncbi:hypothetical protein BpHYR1_041195 [Brachionus plicatilis]|uniref:Uncharacterized protein n=1 Tax=Brachionus plicatilis TaxID=10195 RepID=A0A3M7T9F5_BRAPC|nr:hypothetical protein BpHYR1_041195 [Brachionus plicatilis]